MIRIEIDSDKLEQLRSVVKEPLANLQGALEQIKGYEELSSRKQLEDTILEHTSRSTASAVTDMLISFTSFVDGTEASLDDVIEALLKNAESSGLSSEEVESLSERSKILKSLCEVPRVGLIGKSRELRDTAGNKLLQAKVYTFSRPIFDHSRENIEGAMVLSSMRIDYLNQRGEQDSFEVTLSQRQLAILASDIQKGIQKVEAYDLFLRNAGLQWVMRYEK